MLAIQIKDGYLRHSNGEMFFAMNYPHCFEDLLDCGWTVDELAQQGIRKFSDFDVEDWVRCEDCEAIFAYDEMIPVGRKKDWGCPHCKSFEHITDFWSAD